MSIENIKEIIEKKMEKSWYNSNVEDIDYLVEWFIKIWNSLVDIEKDKINDKEKKKIIFNMENRLNILFTDWFPKFIKKLKDNKIELSNINNIKNKEIININNKLFNYIEKALHSNKKNSDSYIKKIPFLTKQVLLDNYKIIIDYIKDKDGNKYIKIYKELLLDFYTKIYNYININYEIITNYYDNWIDIFRNKQYSNKYFNIYLELKESWIRNLNKKSFTIEELDKFDPMKNFDRVNILHFQ